MASLTVLAGTAVTVGATDAVGAPVATSSAGAGATPSATAGLAPRVQHSAVAPKAGIVPAVGTATRPSKGARRLTTLAPGATAGTAAATSTAPAVSPARPAALRININGVSSRDSAVTNFNLEFEPPDQGLCEGNGYVVEPVNSAYAIYGVQGGLRRGPFNVNDLFNEGAQEFTSDPRCYFDSATQRWFATILFINDASTAGRIDIAVSQSADPTGLWFHYQIDTTEPGGNGCPCFGDQPRLGIDQNNLYLSTDEFSITGPQYDGGRLYAVAKRDLLDGAPLAHYARYANLTVDTFRPFSIEPATSVGTAPAEYFIASLDPNGTSAARLAVWALTRGEQVAIGGTPPLTKVVVGSQRYSMPPPAVQRGSNSTLDSGDDRMQQAQFVNGTLWAELDSGVRVAGGSGTRAGAAWFALRPELRGGVITAAPVIRQGYVVAAGKDVLYPALQADAAGRAAMVFTVTGAGMYPSAGFALLAAGATSFGPISIAASGSGPYDRNATRWGDYSYATLDPASDTVWLATEYVPPVSSQTVNRRRNWGTRVFEVALS